MSTVIQTLVSILVIKIVLIFIHFILSVSKTPYNLSILVIHAFVCGFADDFNQFVDLYHHADGIIMMKQPGPLYRYDDFEVADYSVENDFYFSINQLINYQ